MTQTNKKQSKQKVSIIIDSTLEVLRNHGEQGFSMRKVAAKAGMSLGNLQFYFKNKDALLKGMVDAYFDYCCENFNSRLVADKPNGKREFIEFLVNYGIDYSDSEIGAIFRELWGFAARNESIKQQLNDYYQTYIQEISKLIRPFAKSPNCVSRLISLIIPYFDGLAFVAIELPTNRKELKKFLIHLIESALNEEF